MAFPAYVVQRDIVGDSAFENVVVLKSEGGVETLLYWDWLEDLDQDAYDPYSAEVDIIAALRAANYRNQSLYDYLKFAIVVHTPRTGALPVRDYPLTETTSRSFNPNYNSTRVGKYSSSNSLAVYTPSNVFTYVASYGPSHHRDDLTIVGSGSVSAVGGKIRLSTGTTPGSSVRNETVEHGRYVPGSASDGSAAIFLPQALTGDQYIEVGIGNDDDSGVFHFNALSNEIRITRGGVLIETIPQVDWNINKCDGTEPERGGIAFELNTAVDGYIYSVNYTWYGIGKILFSITKPVQGTPETLTEIPVHEYFPEGVTFIDPNLPVVVKVDNGSTSDDIAVDIGGRKYDIHGSFIPETRKTITIVPLSSLNARRSVFSVRKKEDFPEAGRENTVPVYLTHIEVSADAVGFIRAYSVPRGTITGTWVKPPEIIDVKETSIEVNTSIVDITGVATRHISAGPIIVLGATPKKVVVPNVKGEKTPILNEQEMVIEYDPQASSSGYLIIEFTEEW